MIWNQRQHERIDALMELRNVSPGARTAAVVESMLALAESLENKDQRAAIYRNIKGAITLEFKPRLLLQLSSEPFDDVRSEIVETLGPLKDDPEIRDVLERLADADPSESVRREARRSLRSERERR
jgi:HEAT repeat protein